MWERYFSGFKTALVSDEFLRCENEPDRLGVLRIVFI